MERMLQDWEKTPGHMTALDLKVGGRSSSPLGHGLHSFRRLRLSRLSPIRGLIGWKGWLREEGCRVFVVLQPLLGDKAIEEVEMEDEPHAAQGDQPEGHTHAAPQDTQGDTGPALASETPR